MQNVANAEQFRTLTLPAWNVKAVSFQLALLVLAALVLPAAAHMFGLPVRTLLPMHWPILLAGVCYGWRSGLIIGMCAPVFSYFVSGMPPAFMLPAMTLELAVYGFVAGISREWFKLGWLASTFAALVIGRVIFLGYVFAAGAASLPFLAYLQAAMLPGLAGVLGQLILIPTIARKWVGSK